MPGAGKACAVASEGCSVPISNSPASVTHQQGAGPTRHPDQVTVSVSVSQMHCCERPCGSTAAPPGLRTGCASAHLCPPLPMGGGREHGQTQVRARLSTDMSRGGQRGLSTVTTGPG